MTDPPRARARRPARISLSALEWRAYLAAALAAVYAAVWLAAAPSSPASPPTSPPAPRTVTAPQVARPPATRVRSAPKSRPIRIRTRSS